MRLFRVLATRCEYLASAIRVRFAPSTESPPKHLTLRRSFREFIKISMRQSHALMHQARRVNS